MPGMAGMDLKALGIPTDDEYMKQYCATVGVPPVKDWNYYLAFSFFRIAAILQGVYARSLKGICILFPSTKLFNMIYRQVSCF